MYTWRCELMDASDCQGEADGRERKRGRDGERMLSRDLKNRWMPEARCQYALCRSPNGKIFSE